MPEQARSAERPSEPQANGLTDLLELMKLTKELFLVLRELSMPIMIKLPFFLCESWGYDSPVGIPREEDDDIDIAPFPSVLNNVIIARGIHRFYLNSIVVRAIGNQKIGLMPVIKYWNEYLPPILHQPTHNDALERSVLQRLMRSSLCLS